MLQYEEVITISIGVGVSGMKDLVGGTIFLPSGQNDARSFKVCHLVHYIYGPYCHRLDVFNLNCLLDLSAITTAASFTCGNFRTSQNES